MHVDEEEHAVYGTPTMLLSKSACMCVDMKRLGGIPAFCLSELREVVRRPCILLNRLFVPSSLSGVVSCGHIDMDSRGETG
jgi:hypothetical protein